MVGVDASVFGTGVSASVTLFGTEITGSTVLGVEVVMLDVDVEVAVLGGVSVGGVEVAVSVGGVRIGGVEVAVLVGDVDVAALGGVNVGGVEVAVLVGDVEVAVLGVDVEVTVVHVVVVVVVVDVAVGVAVEGVEVATGSESVPSGTSVARLDVRCLLSHSATAVTPSCHESYVLVLPSSVLPTLPGFRVLTATPAVPKRESCSIMAIISRASTL